MDSANQAKTDSPAPIKLSTALLTDLRAIITKAGYPDVSRIEQEVLDEVQSTWSKTDYCRVDTGQSFQDILDRFQTGEPWEYIRGWAEFCDNRFEVTPKTLIPRIETEVLVETAIKMAGDMLGESKTEHINIIEIGTGSGAIIVSLYKKLVESGYKSAQINAVAVDISLSALEIAKRNADKVLGNNAIQFVESNLLSGLSGSDFTSANTLIVANLPYLSQQEYREIDKSVRNFEPRTALIGGKIGDELYRKLLIESKEFFSRLGNDTNVTSKHKIAQIWEVSPMIIDGLLELVVENGAKATKVLDQYEVERFLRVE